jgi:hypothetical protein
VDLKNKIIKDFDDVCVEELPIGLPPKRPGDYPIIPFWDEQAVPPKRHLTSWPRQSKLRSSANFTK